MYIFAHANILFVYVFKCLNTYNTFSIVVQKKKIVCTNYVYMLETFNMFPISALIINKIDSFVYMITVFFKLVISLFTAVMWYI